MQPRDFWRVFFRRRWFSLPALNRDHPPRAGKRPPEHWITTLAEALREPRAELHTRLAALERR